MAINKTMDFYNVNGIKWFFFTPGMSTVIGTNYREKMHICLGADITYENGATVLTSFATNLEPAGIRTDPALKRRRLGWDCADGVTIELSDRERALVYGE